MDELEIKMVEELLPQDKKIVVELVEEIKNGFEKLIKALDPEKYPKARTYIGNFSKNALLVFEYWLEGKGWIPLTTNAIESAFSRLFGMNFGQNIKIHKQLRFSKLRVSYAWI